MGGEITVMDLGNQEYQVNLVVYRDTLGIPMATTADIIFDGPNSSFTITIPYDSVISGNLLPMYPYGVEVYFFTDTVTLTDYGQWDVSWNDCCRNMAILNLSAPLSENMTLHTSIVTDSASANSTPFFLVPAAIFLPQNTSWQYNPLPFDPDGDSLHWSIDQPLNAVGSYCAGYVTPSSDPTNVFSINPITGTITWTADLVGNFVASVLVEQYRNGVWVGEIRRDMQFIVVPSGQGFPQWNNLSALPTDVNNNYAFNLIAGEQFSLQMIASHSNPNQEVYMEAYGEIFHLAQTDASFTETIYPSYTEGNLTWQPTGADFRMKPYHVVFRVSDGFFTDDRTVLLNVNTPLGVVESTSTSEIKTYPNPTTSVFYIEIDQSVSQLATLDVYTLSGQRVISQKQLRINEGKNVFMIETDSWNPGTYFLQLNGSSEKLLNQVVIKK
jgi:hypothetical protein